MLDREELKAPFCFQSLSYLASMNFLNSVSFRRASAISFYILILLGSSIPGKKIPYFFTLTPDKLIHCTEYFIFGILLLRWLAAELANSHWKKIAALVLVVVAMCGAIDELYQNLTPNRTP